MPRRHRRPSAAASPALPPRPSSPPCPPMPRPIPRRRSPRKRRASSPSAAAAPIAQPCLLRRRRRAARRRRRAALLLLRLLACSWRPPRANGEAAAEAHPHLHRSPPPPPTAAVSHLSSLRTPSAASAPGGAHGVRWCVSAVELRPRARHPPLLRRPPPRVVVAPRGLGLVQPTSCASPASPRSKRLVGARRRHRRRQPQTLARRAARAPRAPPPRRAAPPPPARRGGQRRLPPGVGVEVGDARRALLHCKRVRLEQREAVDISAAPRAARRRVRGEVGRRRAARWVSAAFSRPMAQGHAPCSRPCVSVAKSAADHRSSAACPLPHAATS